MARKRTSPVKTAAAKKATVKTTVEEVTTVEKAAETGKETAPASVKAEAAAPAKEVVKETAPVKEETAAKEEAKKTVTRKTAIKEEFVLEFDGKQVTEEEIIKNVKENWTKVQKNKIKDIKSIKVFLQPENGCAYYTINGEGNDDYKVEL